MKRLARLFGKKDPVRADTTSGCILYALQDMPICSSHSSPACMRDRPRFCDEESSVRHECIRNRHMMYVCCMFDELARHTICNAYHPGADLDVRNAIRLRSCCNVFGWDDDSLSRSNTLKKDVFFSTHGRWPLIHALHAIVLL